MIISLNEEQQKKIPFYTSKWQKFTSLSEKINKVKAENILEKAYNILGYEEPLIIFADNPITAIEDILSQEYCQIEIDIKYCLCHQIWTEIKNQLTKQTVREIRWENEQLEHLILQYKNQLFFQAKKKLIGQLDRQHENYLTRLHINTLPEKCAIYGSQSDFCISVLNCEFNFQRWEIFKSLINDCGLIFCFKKIENIDILNTKLINVAIICDRPIQGVFV